MELLVIVLIVVLVTLAVYSYGYERGKKETLMQISAHFSALEEMIRANELEGVFSKMREETRDHE